MAPQTISNVVHEYLDAYSQPREKSWKEKLFEYFPKYNPELAEVSKRTKRNKDLIQKLEECLISEEDDRNALAVVEQKDPSYTAGLAFGYLLPEVEYNSPTVEFAQGFKKGQIYALKKDCSHRPRSLITKGLALIAAGQIVYMRTAPYIFASEDSRIHQPIQRGLTYGAAISIIYGIGTMLASNLFMNDAKLSNKLITTGPFAMHRNPFYAGLIASIGCSVAKEVCANAFAENPNWLATAIATAGFAFMTKGFIDYTKNDEKVLEKQFGDEYREYKKSTPRFFPKISNLWRKKK